MQNRSRPGGNRPFKKGGGFNRFRKSEGSSSSSGNGGGGGYRGGSRGGSRFGGGGGNRSRGGSSFGRNTRRRGSYIDPSRYINKPKGAEVQEVVYEPKHQFADFGFPGELQKTLDRYGYKTPTPIQDGAIPYALQGKDLIGLANTGSGKTAAFLLPAIQRLIESKGQGQVLIIAPTRELAVQIERELFKFTYGIRLYCALCVGGASMHTQRSMLSRNPNFVIGTPGRLKDHIDRGTLRLDRLSIFVLDEVDRMLDMGFLPDISYIISKLPAKKQTLCFSATMNQNINRLLDKMLVDPVTVSVRTSETGEHIEQDVIRTSSREEKHETLVKLLKQEEFDKVIIFSQTKIATQKLSDFLSDKGFKCDAIHGDKSQGQRNRALRDFKENKTNILVATDVAARGLDIPNVSHVINFEEPENYEDYIHRIGRTGRAGKKGKALTFVKIR